MLSRNFTIYLFAESISISNIFPDIAFRLFLSSNIFGNYTSSSCKLEVDSLVFYKQGFIKRKLD
jgi:hypothetical protein